MIFSQITLLVVILRTDFEVFEHMIHALLTKIEYQASMLAHWQIFSKVFKKDFELM